MLTDLGALNPELGPPFHVKWEGQRCCYTTSSKEIIPYIWVYLYYLLGSYKFIPEMGRILSIYIDGAQINLSNIKDEAFIETLLEKSLANSRLEICLEVDDDSKSFLLSASITFEDFGPKHQVWLDLLECKPLIKGLKSL